jgi:hypothetical protein
VITVSYLVVLMLLGIQAKKLTRFDFNQVAYRPQPLKPPQDAGFETKKASGMNIYVPISGDRCYDHALPCTPYPDSTVVLRGATLQSGFRHAF